jgi:hypothetical protein
MEPEDYFHQTDHDRWSKTRISAFILNRLDEEPDDIELLTDKLFHFMIMNGVCDPRDIDDNDFSEILES